MVVSGSASQTGDLLDPSTVGRYLVGRGLAGDPRRVRAALLGGGVSNVVLGVGTGTDAFVVKQALPRLRVADEWRAPCGRVLTEAAALDLAARLVPGVTPRVLDRDPERNVIVIERAPGSWSDWKRLLLQGRCDVGVAARLGGVLAAWHSADVAGVDQRCVDLSAFEQLRVDPYYRTVMRRRPEHAERVGWHAEAMAGRRTALVHGDFSPKNVLVGEGGALWVIDFEVAHVGDPAFDVAFLLSHLLLKSVFRPADRDRYEVCASAFADSYLAAIPPSRRLDWGYVAGHVACLMLARVDGKSPVEYLDAAQRGQARRIGAALLCDPPSSPRGLWEVRGSELRRC
ncbi:MAG: phosphotransferase [Micromonosporaceae bacterium]|nr:phosphotransferase [Micromonosporaceae bacterium]